MKDLTAGKTIRDDVAALPGDAEQKPEPMKRFKFLSKKLNERMATFESAPALDIELSRYLSDLENVQG